MVEPELKKYLKGKKDRIYFETSRGVWSLPVLKAYEVAYSVVEGNTYPELSDEDFEGIGRVLNDSAARQARDSSSYYKCDQLKTKDAWYDVKHSIIRL